MKSSFKSEVFERGAAMLEAAIIIPFLLITSLSCWDTSKMLNAHALMLQSADDIAQWAASDPTLENGEYEMKFDRVITPQDLPLPKSETVDLCLSALGYKCAQCKTVNGVRTCLDSCSGSDGVRSSLCEVVTAVESSDMPEIEKGSVEARINFTDPTRVEVVLSTEFDGFFLYADKRIYVRKMVPYLGPR